MITIVGAGALGSHVALFLRNLQDPLRVVDFDKVEQKNVWAQFHSKMSVRRNKAESIRQSLKGLFEVDVESRPYKLSKDNVDALLANADLVLDCTDNIAARNLIQGYATDFDIPCLHGSLSADGAFARVMWSEHFEADAEGEDGEATCIDGEHLPFFAAAAAYMAIEAKRFMDTGKKQSFQLSPAGLLRLT